MNTRSVKTLDRETEAEKSSRFEIKERAVIIKP